MTGSSHGALNRRDLLTRAGLAGLVLLTGGCGSDGAGSGSNGVVTVSGTAVAATPTPAPTPSPTPTPTPTVSPAPTTTRFGANCFDLFYAPLMNGLANKDPLLRLQAMKNAGIAFVRFSASPYWPSEWASTWYASQSNYLSVLDAVFAAAEKVGMPLVPSAVWAPFAISDHFGERYSAWGNAGSQSRQFLANYVPVIVNRYRGSGSLMMWEFANEMSDFADLPNGDQFWPPISVSSGTFASRTADDRITSAAVQSAYSAFAALVRGTGDTHPIGAGSGMPRYNQVNNASNQWQPDTVDQFKTALGLSLSGQTNVLSTHLYPSALNNRFAATQPTYADILTDARAVADGAGAALFVGEFGVASTGDDTADKAVFSGMIAAIKAAKVDYAAFWNYDYWDATDPNNVTPTNSRAWVLKMIAAANA